MAGMTKFKSVEDFKKEVKQNCVWEDYFKVNNLTYKIYEYGGGWKKEEDCYVYFYNKYTKTMFKIIYLLNPYKFKSFEVIENPFLWRTDTL